MGRVVTACRVGCFATGDAMHKWKYNFTVKTVNEEDDLIDLTYLNEQMNGKSEQINKILQLFVEKVPPFIAEIRQLLEDKQWATLVYKVHALKSYYWYVGNKSLILGLEDWEQALKNNPKKYSHTRMLTELMGKTDSIIGKLNAELRK
jgi:HPt (histidine-containing phosphotransfer) domain-containing protein